MALGIITAVFSGTKKIAFQLGDYAEFGSKKGGGCTEGRQKLTKIFEKLPEDSKRSLANTHRKMFGSNIKPTGSSIAFHYTGGEGCRVTSAKGQKFIELVNDEVKKHEQEIKRKAKAGQSANNSKRQKQSDDPEPDTTDRPIKAGFFEMKGKAGYIGLLLLLLFFFGSNLQN